MNKEEAARELRYILKYGYHNLLETEVDALKYAIHFLQSAEEVIGDEV